MAVDAHRPFLTRNKKEQPDVWVLQNIADALEHLIAHAIRQVQRVLISNPDKARRVAFG